MQKHVDRACPASTILSESEITEDNLDPIIRNLRVSLASVEHHAKEAFEKTQRDITTLRQIQKLAATLRWPESRKVGAMDSFG